VKIGDLVYHGELLEMGHLLLGIIAQTKRTAIPCPDESTLYYISWVDTYEPEWYYKGEVELIK